MREFHQLVQPFLQEYCMECHNQDNMESGIRVDRLDGGLDGRTPFLWRNIREQLALRQMPPAEERPPTDAQREAVITWIDEALDHARRQPRPKNGAVRRLTIAQYQNTLSELLGVQEDFTSLLPPDAVSKEGFLNQEQSMVLSPLLIEAYFEVAERALECCLVDPSERPTIQNFRVDLGRAINPLPCPDTLILGANSHLLNNGDFRVTQLEANKSFTFSPFWMRTKYRFHEGYQGNDTVRGWRNYDSIYHAVFACMRGTDGYPLGNAYDLVPTGLLLRPATPSTLRFGESSTYGPRANFKIALRELPDHGRFRVTVTAARYDDALLLENVEPFAAADSLHADLSSSREANFEVIQAGVYQLDVRMAKDVKELPLTVSLGDREFAGQLSSRDASDANDSIQTTAFLQARLPLGPLRVTLHRGQTDAVRAIRLTRIPDDSPHAMAFLKFEKRQPTLGVHVGLRRDCGHTLSPIPQRYRVESRSLERFVFEDAINNFPRPEVESHNDNYLAGVREIAVHSEYTDGRQIPRTLIRSVEFEGPLYETWPPQSHRRIFIPSDHPPRSRKYTREILEQFASRAFRRPVSPIELDAFMDVFDQAQQRTGDFYQSVQDALLVVLTSPQFLFQIETSQSPDAEPLDDFELASKLSYLLWNAPPDEHLHELAKRNRLRVQLDQQVDRLIDDPRFLEFCQQFCSQWLALDKLDVVSTDHARYPKLTSLVKRELRREPVQLFRHLAQENRPLRNLVQSGFVVANETVATYYGLGEQVESGFDFQPVQHGSDHLGGLLAQAGILAGLSDGRESNPVKRGAWLARKIIGEPPDDPPPNVPELTADDPSLTLRERLALHRNQPGCAKCHEGIDPWGLPLETFDAGGRFKPETDRPDTTAILPDTSKVADIAELKEYLAVRRMDQVALSFLKHLATYASGRELSYNEIEWLRETGLELKPAGYPVRDLLHLVVTSPIFLEK